MLDYLDFYEHQEKEIVNWLLEKEVRYLARGTFSVCFEKDNMVYSVVKNQDKSKSVLCEVESPHLPKIKMLIEGDYYTLYEQPKLKLIPYDEMNAEQKCVFEKLVSYNMLTLEQLSEMELELPNSIVDTFTKLAEQDNKMMLDISDDDVGWEGNQVVLFDIFV